MCVCDCALHVGVCDCVLHVSVCYFVLHVCVCDCTGSYMDTLPAFGSALQEAVADMQAVLQVSACALCFVLCALWFVVCGLWFVVCVSAVCGSCSLTRIAFVQETAKKV